MVVLSHRHNKEDTIAKKDERIDLDFSLVRDTMYKYSKKAQDRFFRIPCLAFLFLAFANSQDGLNFIHKKFYEEKGEDYLKRMNAEMGELRQDACDYLRKAVKNDKLAKDLHSIITVLSHK
jgi:hypothetical protein